MEQDLNRTFIKSRENTTPLLGAQINEMQSRGAVDTSTHQLRGISTLTTQPVAQSLAGGLNARGREAAGGVLDAAAFVARPFGALQAAAAAPIGYDYKPDAPWYEPLKVSAKAFGSEAFPTLGEPRPAYEDQIIQKYAPDMPDEYRPGAALALSVITDPAVLALPFAKSLQSGLKVAAATKTETGPWRHALEQSVSMVDMKAPEAQNLTELASKADHGDQQAANTLLNKVEGKDKIKEARTSHETVMQERIDSAFGKQDRPTVELVPKEKAEHFINKYETTPLEKMVKKEVTKGGTEKNYAININLNHINGTADIDNLLKDARAKILAATGQEFKDEINSARRGTIKEDELRALADVAGVTPANLLKTEVGTAWNAEHLLAARRVLVDSADQLVGLAHKFKEAPTPELQLALQKHISVHRAIQAKVSGLTAEAGRALQQFNQLAGGTKTKLRQIDEMLGGLGKSGEMTNALADALTNMNDINQINYLAKNAHKATTWDAFYEVWINGLLSGPQTHIVNTLSNAATLGVMGVERTTAAAIGKFSKAFGAKETVELGEAKALWSGMMEGIKDGFAATAKTIKTGEAQDVVGKMEVAYPGALSAEALDLSGNIGRAVDYLGKAVRLPGQALQAEDAFFKSIGYRMELKAQAFRQARAEGLTGEALGNRMAAIVENPPEDLHLAAVDSARYATYTNKLGDIGQKYLKLKNSSRLLQLVTPFVRTPVNVVKFGLSRTPFTALSKGFWTDIAAGGARRDSALARISLGTTAGAAIWYGALQGHVTGGGPKDRGLRSALYEAGWQPYSIKAGDKWISYARIEPFATIFGTAADAAEIGGQVNSGDWDGIWSSMALAIAKNSTNKTFTRGLSDVITAWNDPDRYGERYLLRLFGSLTPTFVAQVNRAADPTLRNTREAGDFALIKEMVNTMKSRTPGFSADLPPRLNLWGEKIYLGSTTSTDVVPMVFRMLNPFYASDISKDTASKEIVRLGMSAPMPSKLINSVKLNPKQYNLLISAMNTIPHPANGMQMHDYLNAMIQGKINHRGVDYPKQSDEIKELMVRDVIYGNGKSGYLSASRTWLVQNDPSLEQAIDKVEAEKAAARQMAR